jgi:hypothetical protein
VGRAILSAGATSIAARPCYDLTVAPKGLFHPAQGEALGDKPGSTPLKGAFFRGRCSQACGNEPALQAGNRRTRLPKASPWAIGKAPSGPIKSHNKQLPHNVIPKRAIDPQALPTLRQTINQGLPGKAKRRLKG